MAVTPSGEISRVVRDFRKGVDGGDKFIRGLLEETRRLVQTEIAKAAVGGFQRRRLGELNDAIEPHIERLRKQLERRTLDNIVQSAQAGIQVVRSPAAAAGEVLIGGFDISTPSLEALKKLTVDKIGGLSKQLLNDIQARVSFGVIGGATPQQVKEQIGGRLAADLLRKGVRDPSLFAKAARRARVITETEMGRAFSIASQEELEAAVDDIPDLEKQWLHNGNPAEPRPSHLRAHGQVRKVGEAFDIGGVAMMFPRDPGAPLNEVINCTCTHIPKVPGWETEKIVVRTKPK